MATPLEGIRVLDMSRILAGPWATQTLGDMGAAVIKVERPYMGDDSRIFGPPFLRGREGDLRQTSMFLCANRNKKSIAVDYTKPEGRDILLKLAAQSDVLVENYKVGTLARNGLGYEDVRKVNSRLVYCSISGFGQSGPYADRGATDPIIQAMSGLMSVTGHPEGEPGGTPMKAGPSVVDIVTGLYLVIAVQGALYHREQKTGCGQYIDLSLLDGGLALVGQQATNYFMSGVPPQRRGAEGNGGAPGGTYRCADGDIMVAPNSQDLYARMCNAMGAPELGVDPRFASNPLRVVNRKVLRPLVEAIILRWKVKDLHDALTKAGVPCTTINNLEQVFNDPQVKRNEMTVQAVHPQAADQVRLMRNPIRYSDTPLEQYTAPPELGEHTDEVLGGMLGFDRARLTRLREAKVIQ